jgi:hypothetical protein
VIHLHLIANVKVSIYLFFLKKIIDYDLGEDDLEVTWLRNQKEIPENPDFRREREGDTFRLVVAEV